MNTIHYRKSESGQAIVLLVFGMIVLMGMAGLARGATFRLAPFLKIFIP